jgi:hypothetical protein
MRDTDKPWRSFLCPNCHATVLRLYKRQGRITADYRTKGTLVDAGPTATTTHQAWFTGIDVADELSDCTDSQLNAECNGRVHKLSLRRILEDAHNSTEPSIILTVS